MTSVALVVLDTLRKDAFDDHFDWLPGVQFENAWSPSHWTVPAHAALFTGKYASEAGVYAGEQELDYPHEVLAEQAQRAGYTTRAHSSNVNISRTFGFHRGFDEFEGSWRLDALEENVFDWDEFIVDSRGDGPERFLKAFWECVTGDFDTVPSLKRGAMLKLRDLGLGGEKKDDGASEALDYVQATNFGNDEFLFLNLMEAHTPYSPPEEYQTVEPPELDGLRATLGEPEASPDRLRAAYEDSVRYLSDIYGSIYQELEAEFDYVITLADHGEVLGEHGAWEHLCGLYPELTHVPLCISGPDLADDEREDTVSLLDVHRTVLDLLDVEEAGSRGRSLVDPDGRTDNTRCLTEYHGLTPRHRKEFAAEFGQDRIDPFDQEYYGIATADAYAFESPGGGFTQAGSMELYAPEDHIDEMLRDLDKRTGSGSVEVSDTVERQLEELGYA